MVNDQITSDTSTKVNSVRVPPKASSRMDNTSGTSEKVLGVATFFSWKSVFAGTAISLLSFFVLSILGIAIGASVFNVGEVSGTGYGWGTAIWTILTVIIALAVGGYAAARLSNYITDRVGIAQGATIAALFFAFLLWQGGSAIGSLGSSVFGAVGSAVGGAANAASGVASLAQQPVVQDTVQRALDRSGIQIEGEPQQVIQGVASRLLAGDVEAAQAYLANNSNISVEQAEQRLGAALSTIQSELAQAANTVASAMAVLAWSMFVVMIVGIGAAMIGGAWGSRENFRHPLVHEERRRPIMSQQPAHA